METISLFLLCTLSKTLSIPLTPVLYLTDYIRREVDKGNFCSMAILDLQKAFEMVDHAISLPSLVVSAGG